MDARPRESGNIKVGRVSRAGRRAKKVLKFKASIGRLKLCKLTAATNDRGV